MFGNVGKPCTEELLSLVESRSTQSSGTDISDKFCFNLVIKMLR